MLTKKKLNRFSKILTSLVLGLFLSLSFSNLAYAASPMDNMSHADMLEQDCGFDCEDSLPQNSCLKHCLDQIDHVSIDSLQTPQKIHLPTIEAKDSEPETQPKAVNTFSPQTSLPPPKTWIILKTEQLE